jgi:hypothetical protein
MKECTTERSMEPVRALRDALDAVIATHEEYQGQVRRAHAARRALNAYQEALGPQVAEDGLLDILQREVERAEAGLEELRIRHCRARQQVEEHGDRIRWDSLDPPPDRAPETPATESDEAPALASDGAPTAGRSGTSEASAESSAPPEAEARHAFEGSGPSTEGPPGARQADAGSLWAEILREEAGDAGFQPEAAPKS